MCRHKYIFILYVEICEICSFATLKRRRTNYAYKLYHPTYNHFKEYKLITIAVYPCMAPFILITGHMQISCCLSHKDCLKNHKPHYNFPPCQKLRVEKSGWFYRRTFFFIITEHFLQCVRMCVESRRQWVGWALPYIISKLPFPWLFGQIYCTSLYRSELVRKKKYK